eukprot:COSAG02_NODE_426_length_22559_cov_5.439403_5_plen_39_part_00
MVFSKLTQVAVYTMLSMGGRNERAQPTCVHQHHSVGMY